MNITYIKPRSQNIVQDNGIERDPANLDAISSALFYLESIAISKGLTLCTLGLRYAQYMCEEELHGKTKNREISVDIAFDRLMNDLSG